MSGSEKLFGTGQLTVYRGLADSTVLGKHLSSRGWIRTFYIYGSICRTGDPYTARYAEKNSADLTPRNVRCRTAVGLTLGQRCRRWTNVKTTTVHAGQSLVICQCATDVLGQRRTSVWSVCPAVKTRRIILSGLALVIGR